MKATASFLRKNIGAVFLSILFLVVIGTEFFFRITSENKLRRWEIPLYIRDTSLGYRYVPNSTGIFKNTILDIPFKANSQGFLGPDFSLQKAQGTYRILLLAMSNETGLFIGYPACYVNILQNLFNENGYKVEIINCSVDGREKIRSNISFIKNEGMNYNSDLVLLLNEEMPFPKRFRFRTTYKGVSIECGKNDGKIDYLEDAKEFVDRKIDKKDFSIYLFDYCYIYRKIVKYYLDNHKDRKDKVVKLLGEYIVDKNKMLGYARGSISGWNKSYKPSGDKKEEVAESKILVDEEEESLQTIRQLRDTLLLNNSKLLVYNIFKTEKVSQYKELYSNKNIEYLSLDIKFNERYIYGQDDGHLNKLGHLTIANAFYRQLITMNIPKVE